MPNSKILLKSIIALVVLVALANSARSTSLQRLNPDISLNGLFAAGYFSEKDHLNFGGHDPNERGFTVQQIEMSLKSIVGPYFTGEAHINFGLSGGESFVEAEEAFLTSLALPLNLQLSGGQFFTRFGRLNAMHSHTRHFADQPIIHNRLFGGDGLRQVGTQLSYLLPLPIYTKLVLSMQNPHGPTAVSFFNTVDTGGVEKNGHHHGNFAPSIFFHEHEGSEQEHTKENEAHHQDEEEPGVQDATYLGRPLIGRDIDSLADFIYMTRLQASIDATDTLTWMWGGSALFGPNATGEATRTTIMGTDLYVKWQPLSSIKGWPFLAWQSELIRRNYEADEFIDHDNDIIPSAEVRDWGLYSQLIWGFRQRWVAGMRGEFTDGEEATAPLQDRRYRLSTNLTFYPSEFSKWRLQYNYDVSESQDDVPIHALFLQWEFLIGAHSVHTF